MSRLEELKAAQGATFRAYEAARDEARREGDEAAAKARYAVASRHEAKLAELNKAAAEAKRAYEAEVSAQAGHPLEGKVVVREVRRGRWQSLSPKIERGMVRVHRAGDPGPGATGAWRRPNVGQTYILAIKKDRSPGVRVLDVIYRKDGDLGSWKVETP